MRGINISEVFCEVLSGLAIMVSLIAILDVIGTSSIGNTVELFSSNFDVATLGGLIFLAYVMGLLMDAVGLVIGDLFLELFWTHSRKEFDVVLRLVLTQNDQLINRGCVARVVGRWPDKLRMSTDVGRILGSRNTGHGLDLAGASVAKPLRRRLDEPPEHRLGSTPHQLLLATADTVVALGADAAQSRVALKLTERSRDDVITFTLRRVEGLHAVKGFGVVDALGRPARHQER